MVLRTLGQDETELLKDFIYEAIFVPEGEDAPDRSIVEKPELAVYYKDYRGKGIGTAMMEKMLGTLKQQGYKKVSLSCQKANYAAQWYRRLGFKVYEDKDDEYIMVYEF